MRDTDYATLKAQGQSGDFRIELLFVKGEQQEEIRFSWWPGGNLANRPPDLPERELLPLMGDAIRNGVFSPEFLKDLQSVIAQNLK